MKIRLARIDRVAKRINAEYVAEQNGTDELLGVIGRCILHHQPDLRLVGEADTDAATYAKIQSTLAYARGDWTVGRAWHAKVPPERLPRKPGEPDRVYYGRVIASMAAGSTHGVDADKLAIERARKRLGLAPDAKKKAAAR